MLSYEVTVHLDDLSLARTLERYMTAHVAEVVAAGGFVDGRFERNGDGDYRSRYTVRTREDLERYVEEHAPRLRADFLEHFPDGVRVGRAVWVEVTAS